MSGEHAFRNVRLVLPDRTITGTLVTADGLITDIAEDRSGAGSDCQGDFLLPGLIEIHTDNLEKYVVPRPGIYWPALTASIIAHDNQVLGSGITTVLDAVAIGFDDSSDRHHILDRSVEAIGTAGAQGLLRAEHFLHLRCEIASACAGDIFRRYSGNPLVKLVSVMDHTPGQRQWRDLAKWRTFHKEKKWTDSDAIAIKEHRQVLQTQFAAANLEKIITAALEKSLPVASHDDTTAAHAREASARGIGISEFPTTLEAARQAGALGMKIIMGAPNMVRGESHSGNVSARLLAEEGLLDGFSSDYMPISLLHAAFELNRQLGLPLHRAVATVTANIDRGSLEVGMKADVIRVRLIGDLPVVREVWKNGQRVFCPSNGA
jgi:alpha-D-ribose 1-methylphosphonate 5-triphosphate diphosphatase